MSERPPSSEFSTLTRSRRRYLGAMTAALGAGLAGCSAGRGSPSGDGAETDGATTATTATTMDDGATTTADATGTAEDPTSTDSGTTGAGTTQVHAGYETTVVRVTSDGETLGTVTAAIADTSELRYLGLSDTESLPPDRGMLFVFDSVGEHTFVMRGMDFGIDIVYADADGTITRIHHAPEPGPNEDGNDQRYPGRGQYVLEVNYGWTTDHGVEVGDVLEFDR